MLMWSFWISPFLMSVSSLSGQWPIIDYLLAHVRACLIMLPACVNVAAQWGHA
jgi:hypothetical protein